MYAVFRHLDYQNGNGWEILGSGFVYRTVPSTGGGHTG